VGVSKADGVLCVDCVVALVLGSRKFPRRRPFYLIFLELRRV
jgi:hypothetical protein